MKKNVRVFAPGTVANMGCGFDVMGMTLNGVGDIVSVSVSEGDGLSIENKSGVELPEEIDSQLMDLTLTAEMLEKGNRLVDMDIPKGTLVMLVKRGNEFIIPNGQVELYVGDKLLFISENPKK